MKNSLIVHFNFVKTFSKNIIFLTSIADMIEWLQVLACFMKNNKKLYKLKCDKQLFACYCIINGRIKLINPISHITTNRHDLLLKLGKILTRGFPASYFLHLKTTKIDNVNLIVTYIFHAKTGKIIRVFDFCTKETTPT